MSKKDFLTINHWSSEEISEFLDLSIRLKKDLKAGQQQPVLKGKVLGMIFEKPSSRTRVSFDVGMFDLGGHVVELASEAGGLGSREAVQDSARTLSRYVDAILVRTFSHEMLEKFAQAATVPVINGLTDTFHPCQALADALTIIENGKKLEQTHLVYIGDGNNVLHSLIELAAKTQMQLTFSTPAQYQPNADILNEAQKYNSKIRWEVDPQAAVEKSDFIYTDVWVSMGHEEEIKRRQRIFKPYQINQELLAKAPAQAKVLHCLPAHRGQEITDEVLDSDRSLVFDQAENRLHVQKAVLVKLLENR